MTDEAVPKVEDEEQAVEVHLGELRGRAFKVLVLLGVVVIIAFPFSGKILAVVMDAIMPRGVTLNAFDPMEYVYTRILISIYAAVFLILPYILYQTFEFASPGLFPGEKRFLMKVIPLSFLFLGLGIVFSLKVLAPVSMIYLLGYAGSTAEPLPSLSRVMDFVKFMFLITGLIFQFPIVVSLMIKADIVKLADMKKYRKVAYIAFLLLAISLSPDPTPVTPIIITATLIVVYEASLVIARFI